MSKTVEQEYVPSLPLTLVQNDGSAGPNLSYRESFTKIIDEALAIMDSIEQEFDCQINQAERLEAGQLSTRLPSSSVLSASSSVMHLAQQQECNNVDGSTSMTATNVSPDAATKKQ